MNCNKCGNIVTLNDKFCTTCGNALNMQPQPMVQPEPVMPQPMMQPQPMAQPEPVMPQPMMQPQPMVQPEPVMPQPMMQPQPMVQPEPVMPQPMMQPQPMVQPEPVMPQPMMQSQPMERPQLMNEQPQMFNQQPQMSYQQPQMLYQPQGMGNQNNNKKVKKIFMAIGTIIAVFLILILIGGTSYKVLTTGGYEYLVPNETELDGDYVALKAKEDVKVKFALFPSTKYEDVKTTANTYKKQLMDFEYTEKEIRGLRTLTVHEKNNVKYIISVFIETPNKNIIFATIESYKGYKDEEIENLVKVIKTERKAKKSDSSYSYKYTKIEEDSEVMKNYNRLFKINERTEENTDNITNEINN